MTEENIRQNFRLKNIDESRNYIDQEKEQNELMSKKHRKVCTRLNYTGHFLILGSAVTGCISIFVFASLTGIPIWTDRFITRLKICAELKSICH